MVLHLRSHTVGGCDHPTVRDERAAAAELAREETALDERHLPGMRAEAGRVAAHDAIGARVNLAATCERVGVRISLSNE